MNRFGFEWPMKEETRNIELEKELEKRMKRREGYSDKDFKHMDKVYRYSEKDSKHKDEINRKREGKYHEDDSRDYKHKEERYWEDVERDHRPKTGRTRDDTGRKKRSRDHTSEFESKYSKDGSYRHTSSRGGSPVYDDRVSRHKDNKDSRRDDNNNKNIDEISDHRSRRSRSIHDQRLESKRSRTDAVHEERARHTFNSNRDASDTVCIDDLTVERRLKSDSQLPPSSTNKISSQMPPQPPLKARSDSLLGKPVGPNLGRTQTSWNNFPNWPYIPFHPVPAPMFNPFMYQFVPPMLRGLPINMNRATMPYHFTGDGFGNWNNGRTELNKQSLESNVVSVDLQSAVQKNEDLVHGDTDEIWFGQTSPDIVNEENNLDFNIPEVMKVTESSHVSMVEKDDETHISRPYLSKIDVSKDLTRPELYDQCMSMLDLDQASSVCDECDFKILFSEEVKKYDKSNGDSLFAAVDDSVFKKAMSLYAKQKVHVTAMGSRLVEDQEKERCEPSVGDCEVEVKVKVKDSCDKDDGRKEVDLLPGGGGSLLVLTHLPTSDLNEFGSVNLSRIHSSESIC